MGHWKHPAYMQQSARGGVNNGVVSSQREARIVLYGSSDVDDDPAMKTTGECHLPVHHPRRSFASGFGMQEES